VPGCCFQEEAKGFGCGDDQSNNVLQSVDLARSRRRADPQMGQDYANRSAQDKRIANHGHGTLTNVG
jgi:hypothetical protein